ncbi:MAG: flagellar basal body rod protein FlgB [Pseudomonadota bacterium]
MNAIDDYLATGTQALALHARRLDLIASNIANAATPGFKARDIDFAAALKSADTGQAMDRSHGAHLSAGTDPEGASAAVSAGYRIPHQTSLDGNTVELGTEQVAFAENAARYEATIGILNGRIQTLMSAIRGE